MYRKLLCATLVFNLLDGSQQDEEKQSAFVPQCSAVRVRVT